MSACFWPLPISFPVGAVGPRWTSIHPDVTDPDWRKRAEDGLQQLMDTRRAIAEAVAGEAAASRLGPCVDKLKRYVQLVTCAALHLDTAAATAGKKPGFEWEDAWRHEKHRTACVVVEAAWALYNIAVAHTVTASEQFALNTADSLKEAFGELQRAAGVVAAIRESLLAQIPTGDRVGILSPESLEFVEQYLLCGAGLAFAVRAEVVGGTKRSLLVKLYHDVGAAFGEIPVPPNFATDSKAEAAIRVRAYCRTAASIASARAHFIAADGLLEEHEAGPAIAHLQHALGLLAGSLRNDLPGSQGVAWLRAETERITAVHAKAHHRNETVYFARVPPAAPPTEGFGQVKAKPVALGALHKLVDTANPFAAIVPHHAAEAAKRFKAAMGAQLAAKQREVLDNRKRVSQTLSQLGVSGAIATLTKDSRSQCRLPDSLRGRVQQLQKAGEADGTAVKVVERLVTLVSHIHQVAESTRSACEETTVELDAEAKEDVTFMEGFGERVWRPLRKRSDELPDVARLRKLAKETAQAVDETVLRPLTGIKTALEGNAANIARLDWPLDELDALMPYRESEQAVAIRGDLEAAAEHLSKLTVRLDQTVQVEEQRLHSVQAFLNSTRAATALTAAGPGKADETLDALQAELIDHFAVVDSALESRATLLSEAESVMLDIAAKRSADPIAAEVERVCAELEKAINDYEAASAELQELANKAAVLLDEACILRGSAQTIRQARAVEARDFAETLEREIAQRIAAMDAAENVSAEQRASRQRQEALRQEIDRLENERATRAAQAVAQRQQPASAAPPMMMSAQPPQQQPGYHQQPPPPQQQQYPPQQQQPSMQRQSSGPPPDVEAIFSDPPSRQQSSAAHDIFNPPAVAPGYEYQPPPPSGPPPPVAQASAQEDEFDGFFK